MVRPQVQQELVVGRTYTASSFVISLQQVQRQNFLLLRSYVQKVISPPFVVAILDCTHVRLCQNRVFKKSPNPIDVGGGFFFGRIKRPSCDLLKRRMDPYSLTTLVVFSA